jgi:hypothetical protein
VKLIFIFFKCANNRDEEKIGRELEREKKLGMEG